MAIIVETESTLTDRFQTTVPEPIRNFLKLNKRDKLSYRINSSGEVVLARSEDAGNDDPVIGQFLQFLAKDASDHPKQLQPVSSELTKRINELVGHMKVDFNTALSPDDE